MTELDAWRPGLRRAGVLFGAFVAVFVILLALDLLFNEVTQQNVWSSARFMLMLYLFLAVPLAVSLRLSRIRIDYSWLFLLCTAIVGVAAAYGYCQAWFTPVAICPDAYWPQRLALIAIVVVSAGAVTYMDQKGK